MPTVLPTSLNESSMQQQHHSSIVLQATIWKMCKCVEERASLMFLLNVSTFEAFSFHSESFLNKSPFKELNHERSAAMILNFKAIFLRENE